MKHRATKIPTAKVETEVQEERRKARSTRSGLAHRLNAKKMLFEIEMRATHGGNHLHRLRTYAFDNKMIFTIRESIFVNLRRPLQTRAADAFAWQAVVLPTLQGVETDLRQ
jgi:hypothetical protein